MRSLRTAHAGFSLLELSIALVILALLSNSLLVGLSGLRETTENSEVRHQLDDARDALLGFAMRHGRLPCPAAPDTDGNESPANGGSCSHPWNGLLPAITLGIQPVNEKGYAIDPWGNPIRYAISTFKNPACGATPCLSSENGIRSAWNSETPPQPDLRVCNSSNNSSGNAGTAECAAGAALTKDAVAVIFSRGRNSAQSASHPDEMANENADRLFVAHSAASGSQAYDDQMSWISANLLYSRLISAGRLP